MKVSLDHEIYIIKKSNNKAELIIEFLVNI